MGAALIAKPALNRNISVITFGIAQVAMDIEPGIGMLTGADVLHGPSHTILGALGIAYLVMLLAPVVCNFLLDKWNKEVTFHKLPWLVQSEATSKTAVTVGAFFGTLSHVFLDSLMHHDIHPLRPNLARWRVSAVCNSRCYWRSRMVGDAMVGPSRAGCGGERIARTVGGDRASKRLETVGLGLAIYLVLAVSPVHPSKPSTQFGAHANAYFGVRCLAVRSSYWDRPTFHTEVDTIRI
jgi:hypothetical protein